MARHPKTAALAVALSFLSACGLPRDPEGTLQRVRGGTLRVGITEHPPWTIVDGDEPGGVEVTLVEDLAERLDARISWTFGSEAQLFEALERRELDLVIGGFAADDPWAEIVSLTQPYITIRTIVGVSPGTPSPSSADGLRIAAERGTDVPALVEEHDGIPVRVDSLEDASPPVAADEWEVRALGLQPTDVILHESQYAMAIVPGENAWLVYLERYLRSRLSEVPDLLVEQAS
ncbi:MAG TPA: transporter substrate-binding domain-containing protein [Actinomycetota bacterium]|nr:transporter substrate-binding domain-containing protein [Actinomycetota bacterium]